MLDETLSGKSVLITGGTGSFGNAVLKILLQSGVREVRVFSRDEKKQEDMRRGMQNPKIKFFIGDVRDYNSLIEAVKGVDFIFHAAALKQVPSCEFFPIEAVKTNILGTENVLNAAINYSVKRVVCLSTDKAVYAINAMGMSKSLMEKVAIAKSRNSGETAISVTRYGNVMASRGSVIPFFFQQIKQNKPLTVTDPEMTRFIMSLQQAVDLVLFALLNGESGAIYVQKSPATKVITIANAVLKSEGLSNYPIEVIGTRHGEKLYETLLSREEMARAVDTGDYFCIPPDMRNLNYDIFIERGEAKISHTSDYNSHNARYVDLDELQPMIAEIKSKINY